MKCRGVFFLNANAARMRRVEIREFFAFRRPCRSRPRREDDTSSAKWRLVHHALFPKCTREEAPAAAHTARRISRHALTRVEPFEGSSSRPRGRQLAVHPPQRASTSRRIGVETGRQKALFSGGAFPRPTSRRADSPFRVCQFARAATARSPDVKSASSRREVTLERRKAPEKRTSARSSNRITCSPRANKPRWRDAPRVPRRRVGSADTRLRDARPCRAGNSSSGSPCLASGARHASAESIPRRRPAAPPGDHRRPHKPRISPPLTSLFFLSSLLLLPQRHPPLPRVSRHRRDLRVRRGSRRSGARARSRRGD